MAHESRPTKRRRVQEPNGIFVPMANGAQNGEEADAMSSEGSFANFDDEEDSGSDIDLEDAASDSKESSLDDSTSRAMPVEKSLTHHDANDRQTPSTTPTGNTNYTAASDPNLFRLQCEQLLKRVAFKERPGKSSSSGMLFKLKSIIENIPDLKPCKKIELERELADQGVVVPFPDPQPEEKSEIKFGYAKPSSINVVGSHALKTFTKVEDLHMVDMMLEMPPTLFSEKDILNYRYFHKRAAFLACVAAGLKVSNDQDFTISYNFFHGSRLAPAILIEPVKDDDGEFANSKQHIRILATISSDAFPFTKLQPSKNCIRPRFADDGKMQKLTQPPTPFYNSLLSCDCSIKTYHKFLHTISSRAAGFRDACILGRVWLRQRGFSSDIRKGGFGNFEWSIITALLLEGGSMNGQPVLADAYNAQQLFRGTLQYLSNRDLSKQPIFVRGIRVDLPKTPGSPVFYDSETQLNVLFKMTAFSYQHLRSEAQRCANSLANNDADSFSSCFIINVNESFFAHDLVGQLVLPPSSKTDVFTDAVDPSIRFAAQFHQLLQKALGDRATHINISLTATSPWSISEQQYKSKNKNSLAFSIDIDHANASRLVDRGPAPEEQKRVEDFRAFWGEKAELRRFRDGSIQESVVWSGHDSISIVEEIITFIVQTHLKISPQKGFKFFGALAGDFSKLLKSNSDITQFDAATQAFRRLENDIRSLEDFPLQVRHVSPASPQLSTSSLSMPGNGPNNIVPADVVVQFEGSTKWPDNLTAIQITKIAFLLKLSNSMQTANQDITTRLGLENEKSDYMNKAFLDIIYTGNSSNVPTCFRVRIHHDREHTLLQKLLNDSDHRGAAALAVASYKRTFVVGPRHTQAIKTLSTRFPAFSSSIRLLKTWFAAHHLSPYFPPQLIELIAARSFLHPIPWQTTQSAVPGLLRTLVFISLWEWEDTPLLVDFSGTMTADERGAVATRFEAWRTIDSSMSRVAIFAATDFDLDGVTWTEHIGPPKVVVSRLRYLALAAVETVKSQGVQLDIEQLFHSPLRHFNFLLHLDKKFTRAYVRSSKASKQFKNLEQVGADPQLIGFDNVQLYLNELQSTFSDAALFFWDERGGAVIAGLWNPQVERRRWKVGLPWSTVPVERVEAAVNGNGVSRDQVGVDADAIANKKAMLAEMARLGGDMVSSAVLQ